MEGRKEKYIGLILDKNQANESLSEEWLELVKEAMESNVSKDEFKAFIEKHRLKN